MSTPTLGDTRIARFVPVDGSNLRYGAAKHVGHVYEWSFLWVVTEEDGGPYVGQAVWEPVDRSIWFGWVPDEDLRPVQQEAPASRS